MFGIKKFLFGDGPNEDLPGDVREAVTQWLAAQSDNLESSHFLTRYVVVDAVSDSAGLLTGIAACVVHQGVVSPAHCVFVDLQASTADEAAIARRLAAFLLFIGKSPLVSYHLAHVSGLLQPVFKERLGVALQPRWVDLAWLMPAMFSEVHHKPMPLDDWLQAFGLDPGNGRRTPMENVMALARLLQKLVVRAHDKGVDTVDSLINETKASSHLRRTH